METNEKKHYIAPQMEQAVIGAMEVIATSNTSMSFFKDEEQNASGALSNPFNPFRGWEF